MRYIQLGLLVPHPHTRVSWFASVSMNATSTKLDFVHFLKGSIEFFLVEEAQMSLEIPLRREFFNITAFQ